MRARNLLAIVLAVACSFQTTKGGQAPGNPAQASEASSHAATPVEKLSGTPQLQTRNPRYQVRPGDVLDLAFSPAGEFAQVIKIQPDGYITLHQAGDLYVQGKTVPEVQEAVTAAYRQILHSPIITVTLKEFEQPHFIVGGQVKSPGKYEFRTDTTVSEAVAIAGSYSEKAKHSEVLLFRRASAGWVEVRRIDLKSIYKGQVNEDVHLQPGDMVYVPQNRISKVKPYIPMWALNTYFPVTY
jgi:polysaccharide export outer membrane protein